MMSFWGLKNCSHEEYFTGVMLRADVFFMILMIPACDGVGYIRGD